jgi:hypothetical protein
MTLDDHIKPPDHVFAREFDGEIVLLDLNAGLYYGLNAVGSALWKGMCENGKSGAEVAREMLARYDVEESVLTGDVIRLITEWAEKGLVILA